MHILKELKLENKEVKKFVAVKRIKSDDYLFYLDKNNYLHSTKDEREIRQLKKKDLISNYDFVKMKLVEINAKLYLFLKRKETKFDFFKEEVEIQYFYDALFIHDGKIIYMFNTKPNTYFTENDLNNYEEHIYHSRDVLDLDYLLNHYYVVGRFFQPYFFENDVFYFKENSEFHDVLEDYIDYHKIGFFKYHHIGFFKKDKIYYSLRESYYLTSISCAVNTKGDDQYSKFYHLFNQNELYLELLFKECSLPTYLKKYDCLYDMMFNYTFPMLENKWFKNYSTDLFYLFEMKSRYDFVFDEIDKKRKLNELKVRDDFLLFNRHINSLLSKKVYYENNYSSYNLTLLTLFKDVNHLASFIELIPESLKLYQGEELFEQPYLHVYGYSNSKLKEMIGKKFVSYDVLEKGLIKLLKKSSSYYQVSNHIEDLIKMFVYIQNYIEGVIKERTKEKDEKVALFNEKTFTNFQEFETALTLLYIDLSFDKNNMIQFELNKQINNQEIENYTIKQVETDFELKNVGTIMKHCVYSYKDKLTIKKRKRDTDIVVLYDNLIPSVCLEIKRLRNNQLECVQAKCKYNNPLKNSKYHHLVKNYLIENNIRIETTDIE